MSSKRATANAAASHIENGRISVPPRQPRSAFNFYLLESRKVHAAEFLRMNRRTATASEEARFAKAAWDALSDIDRLPFLAKADEDEERYEAEVKSYIETGVY
jgi:hypothetical protein